MDVGPVELAVLQFPDQQVAPGAIAVLADAVTRGYVTVLDAVFIRRTTDGMLRVTDAADDVDQAGLGQIRVRPQALISDGDLTLVGGALKAGTSALMVVYEQRWTRGLASAVEQAGGEVALHVQVPPGAVTAAVAAAVT